MKGEATLTHEFVEYMPDDLKDGTIYVSVSFATVIHKCCCGCGNEVVTPLSPTDWKLTFDGESISLDPSIGNWSFPCQSHYWIRLNRVQWVRRWDQEEIDRSRTYDRWMKKNYYDGTNEVLKEHGKDASAVSLWQRLRKWLLQ